MPAWVKPTLLRGLTGFLAFCAGTILYHLVRRDPVWTWQHMLGFGAEAGAGYLLCVLVLEWNRQRKPR